LQKKVYLSFSVGILYTFVFFRDFGAVARYEIIKVIMSLSRTTCVCILQSIDPHDCITCIVIATPQQFFRGNVNETRFEKNGLIKMRSLITKLALAAALLLRGSVAQAHAYLELISGSTTVQVEPGGAIVGSGPFIDDFSDQIGNGAILMGTIGSWSVNIATGAQSGLNTAPTIALTDNINGTTTQTHGLEVIYSSGGYALSGNYSFGASDTGGNSLTATVSGYYSSKEFLGGSLSSYEGGSTLMGSWGLPETIAASDQNKHVPINGTQYLTEVMLFGGTTGTITPQEATMNVAALFSPAPVSPVPDCGITAFMLGSALLGLAGLRSKFGAKGS
jgi:hypothetical protein